MTSRFLTRQGQMPPAGWLTLLPGVLNSALRGEVCREPTDCKQEAQPRIKALNQVQSLPRTRSGGKPLPRCIEPGFVPPEEVDPEGMRKLIAEIMATAVAGYRQARDPRKRASILAWLEDRDNPHIFGCASICTPDLIRGRIGS